MKRTIILAAFMLLSSSAVFAQSDSALIKERVSFEKSQQEKALRTPEENKLGGTLYYLLRAAESQDTSAQAKVIFTKIMKQDKHLQADSQGRVIVIFELFSLNDSISLIALVQSVNGKVEHVGLVPYMKCRIYPKSLRQLIANGGIRRITEVVPGDLNR